MCVRECARVRQVLPSQEAPRLEQVAGSPTPSFSSSFCSTGQMLSTLFLSVPITSQTQLCLFSPKQEAAKTEKRIRWTRMRSRVPGCSPRAASLHCSPAVTSLHVDCSGPGPGERLGWPGGSRAGSVPMAGSVAGEALWPLSPARGARALVILVER